MIARNSDKPLTAPRKVYFDGQTFLERSKFTKEDFVPAGIEKCLNQLSLSYRLIFLFDDSSFTARVGRMFGRGIKKPVPGQCLAIPMKDWGKVVDESDSILFYVEAPTAGAAESVGEDRLHIFAPDHRKMTRLIDDELVRHQEKLQSGLRTEIRSMYEKRKAPPNRFARKFY